MARKVFFSFYYKGDAARVQQVINMGAVEGQPLLTGQKWEEVERGGDAAVQRWIDGQMKGKECLVVLAGTNTHTRRWVGYEIRKAWSDKLGVVGIRIHGLRNLQGQTSMRGGNPFVGVQIGGGRSLEQIAKLYEPTGADSPTIYANISNNIEKLIEEAVKVRRVYP